MKLTLIGAGAGTAADLTGQARRALEIADVVTGSARLLAALPEFVTARRAPARTAEEMLRALTGAAAPCAVFSGDAGFYSGAAALLNAWPGEWEVAPGVSSLSALAARLGRPWQGWRAVSAHGAACDPVWQVCQGAPVFFLTGREGFAPLCRQLAAAGLGALPAAAGWNLGLADEGVRTATVAALAREPERPLSVLLVDPAPGARPGILPLDDEFVRGRVPMTRLEIRAAALARLRIRPGEVAWDVGAGTGGMAVTLARAGAGSTPWSETGGPAAAGAQRGRNWAPSPCALSPARPRRRWRTCPGRTPPLSAAAAGGWRRSSPTSPGPTPAPGWR